MTRLVRVLAMSAFVAVFVAPAGAQTAASSTPDPRVGLKAGLRDAAVAASGMELLANVPKPDGFFDPKFPAGEPNPPVTDETEKTDGSTSAAKAPPTRQAGRQGVEAEAPGLGRAELRQLGPRVQRQPPLRRQLQRLQHLRHQHPGEAGAADLGRVPGRAGRRVGARQPAVHVGRADARPPRLRRRRRRGSRQQGPLPWRAHLRHLGREDAEAGRGRADVPWLAHAHAGHRPQGSRQRVRVRIGHRRARARPRNSRAAPARTRRRIRRRRSSAST